MSEDTNEKDSVKEEMMSPECRTCLQTLNSDTDLYYIFQSWVPPWEGIENTIAEALEKLAQIQISAMDQHSKVICEVCCQQLHSACMFMNQVKQSDQILQQRSQLDLPEEDAIDKDWPKPIQIDNIVPIDDQMGFEVKQEVLTDDECGDDTNAESQGDMDMLIKIEPEELTEQQRPPVFMNGHHEESNTGEDTSEIPSLNGEESSDLLVAMVKEEPVSDNESSATDLSLDCMLCTKVFNSVSGLKAHVIAHHSYKSVRRKASNEPSPVKRQKFDHVCATCRRGFATSTDLMVHETCHNKSVCYSCNEKFDSFELVMQHRLTCKVVNSARQQPVKTLEDVQRPARSASTSEEESESKKKDFLKCALCGETFTDEYYMNIHLEIHHPVANRSTLAAEDMEVEALESLFTERA